MTSLSAKLRIRIGPDVAHYPPGATFGPRTLRDFEFVWLLSGSASWRYADDDGGPLTANHAQTLRPGMLLLTRPGLADHFTWDSTQPSVHAYVHFEIVEYGPWDAPETWPLIRRLTATDPMAALCRYLVMLGGADAVRAPARAADALGWLLDLFVNGPVGEELDAGLPEHILRIVDHLRDSWRDGRTQPVSLGELAAAAGISRGHLARVFRRRFGLGPVAAVELIRLARAAILLQRSNLSVGAVSNACGFANPFHFSRRFGIAYGASPRAYRNARSDDDPLNPVSDAGLLPLAHRLLVEDL